MNSKKIGTFCASLLTAMSCSSFAATTNSDIRPWPGGVIPYILETEVPSFLAQDIEKAIARINALQIVKLTDQPPSDPDASSVVFTYQKGICSSSFGWRDGTSTLVKVSEDCTYGKILHEIFHALGMVHEQLNPLKSFAINFDHITSSWEDQYTDEKAVALTEHDVHSIMHYHSFENSICSSQSDPKWLSLPDKSLPAPSCRRSNWQQLRAANNNGVDCWLECAVFLHPQIGAFGGQREDLSELDIQGLRKLYGL